MCPGREGQGSGVSMDLRNGHTGCVKKPMDCVIRHCKRNTKTEGFQGSPRVKN